MATRGVWQLKKLIFTYDWWAGSSKGVREFLRGPTFEALKEKHPQYTYEVNMKTSRHPVVTAHYINGYTKTLSLRRAQTPEILDRVNLLKNSFGRKPRSWNKRHITKRPSIQGLWTPDTVFNDPPK
eukprot:TRINITY_DN3626_c0_g1_i3.p1 TRINITY_DN3626_c0_g1~~TRINITY_DN3626_c0_g1_i3.p1  ORF type:complete len:126 (+),score=17.04 TRINITY_DN3626_c0_g1_i3:69-446(+)